MHNTFVTQQTAQQHGMATGYLFSPGV